MLMAYDVRSGIALLSRMYEGGDTDAVFVRELFWQAHLAGMLFLADKGFLSEENLALFTSDSQPVRDPAPQKRQALQGIGRPRGAGGLPGALRLDALQEGVRRRVARRHARRQARSALLRPLTAGADPGELPQAHGDGNFRIHARRGSMRCFPTWA